MKIKVSDLKKGAFIAKQGLVNPQCKDYGALQIMSVKVITEKFCTRWSDWGGYLPTLTSKDYIDRETAIIKMKNETGKVVEHRYWVDELTNPKSDFPNLVFLNATDWKSAHDEARKLVSAEWLSRAHREIRTTLTANYANIFKHSPIVGGKKDLRIKELVGELIDLL